MDLTHLGVDGAMAYLADEAQAQDLRGKITVGLTESERYGDTVLLGGYIPMCDGYRPGAKQTEITIDVSYDMRVGDTDEHWAEAVFVATNAPWSLADGDDWRAKAVFNKIVGHGHDWRALSVGDTVTFEGRRYECARTGWQRLPLAA